MSYLAFCIRLWFRETKQALLWRAAYLLPRSVALIAFVRVYCVLNEIGSDYDRAYRAFESGQGR